MSGTNQTATTTVYVNNEAAKKALIEIEEKLNNIKKARHEAFEKGDLTAFDKLDKDAKKLEASGEKLKKKFFDVNAVLKDLSGATRNDLSKALAMANAELNKMRRDDPGWEAQRRKVQTLSRAVDEAGAASKRGSENAGFLQKSWGNVSGVFAKAIPIIGAAFGSLKAGEAIIKSVDFLADEFDKTVASLSASWDYFKKSVATWDFSNFVENMQAASRAGREYAEALDDLGDRTRALNIQEADSKRYILERMRILRDATKTEQERITAADQIIAKEDELAKKRTDNAKIAYDAEINRITKTNKISKEELEYYIKNYDQLTENIKMGEAYNGLLATSKITAVGAFLDPVKAALKASGMVDMAREQIKKATDEEIKWGETVKRVGKVNEEERNKLVELYGKLQDADVSALENTQKVASRRSALLEETAKNERKVIKETNDYAQKAYEDRIKFENYLQEESIKQIEEWAKEADKLYKEIFDELRKLEDDKLKDDADANDDFLKDFAEKEIKARQDAIDYVNGIKQQSRIDEINASISHLDELYQVGYLKEEEYQNGLQQLRIQKAEESFNRLQQISGIFSNFVNAQQDAELAKMETNKQKELKAAGDNATKKKAIEDKYGKEELAIKKKYADKQFLATVSQIVVAGALAIMQAFAQLGPIGGAIAAVLIGATTAFQISKADEERKRVKALKSGGYTGTSLSDSTPTDFVQYHANEFVTNADGVRNPTIKPVLDVIDMAQRSGTIKTINLPAAITSMSVSRGYQDGGYTSPSASTSSQPAQNSDQELKILVATAIQVMSHLDAKIDHIEANLPMDRFDKDYTEWQKMKSDVKRA